MSVRVRFAPSPTGYLHVGGARTALYNYLFAKKQGGQFILRVEDTDLERSTEEALRKQIQDLRWLGLEWDEGVNPGTLESFGAHGPYRQSERLAIYQPYVDQLLEKGLAYYDFRSDEELQALKDQLKEKGIFRTPRPESIATLSEARERIAAGEQAAVRFKVSDGEVFQIEDQVRGTVKFPSEMVGDFILQRSNGMPVYNFCCVIDDALMKITHVFRAEEHLNNTLRQKMVYEALGFEVPQFAHLSLVLGKDKQKLSKRHGATSCNEYRERGYLPEAVKNYVALLGWSPKNDQEIFSQKDLIESFDLGQLNPSGAVFDEEKLTWMNAEHLRALDNKVIWDKVQPLLKEKNLNLPQEPGWGESAVQLFKSYMSTWQDAVELFAPIDDGSFQVSEEAKEVLSWDSTPAVLSAWKDMVSGLEGNMSEEQFGQVPKVLKEKAGVKGKFLFMPLRVAIIGKPHGAELKALVPLVPKASLLDRVQTCLDQTVGHG